MMESDPNLPAFIIDAVHDFLSLHGVRCPGDEDEVLEQYLGEMLTETFRSLATGEYEYNVEEAIEALMEYYPNLVEVDVEIQTQFLVDLGTKVNIMVENSEKNGDSVDGASSVSHPSSSTKPVDLLPRKEASPFNSEPKAFPNSANRVTDNVGSVAPNTATVSAKDKSEDFANSTSPFEEKKISSLAVKETRPQLMQSHSKKKNKRKKKTVPANTLSSSSRDSILSNDNKTGISIFSDRNTFEAWAFSKLSPICGDLDVDSLLEILEPIPDGEVEDFVESFFGRSMQTFDFSKGYLKFRKSDRPKSIDDRSDQSISTHTKNKLETNPEATTDSLLSKPPRPPDTDEAEKIVLPISISPRSHSFKDHDSISSTAEIETGISRKSVERGPIRQPKGPDPDKIFIRALLPERGEDFIGSTQPPKNDIVNLKLSKNSPDVREKNHRINKIDDAINTKCSDGFSSEYINRKCSMKGESAEGKVHNKKAVPLAKAEKFSHLFPDGDLNRSRKSRLPLANKLPSSRNAEACNEEKSRPILRFKVGDKVDARQEQGRLEGGYEPGVIVKMWDKDGKYPYRIALENGLQVWGPEDTDMYVKKAGSPAPAHTINIEERRIPSSPEHMSFEEWKGNPTPSAVSTNNPSSSIQPFISNDVWGCDMKNLEELKPKKAYIFEFQHAMEALKELFPGKSFDLIKHEFKDNNYDVGRTAESLLNIDDDILGRVPYDSWLQGDNRKMTGKKLLESTCDEEVKKTILKQFFATEEDYFKYEKDDKKKSRKQQQKDHIFMLRQNPQHMEHIPDANIRYIDDKIIKPQKGSKNKKTIMVKTRRQEALDLQRGLKDVKD